jgi:hypothetical protein
MTSRQLVPGLALVAACMTAGVHPTPAAAEGNTISALAIGPRVGLGINPDQIVFGGHMAFGGFHPDWTLSPILELGFGDHQTVVSIDFDGYYHMHLEDSDWRPYFGGGLSIDNFNIDEPAPFEHVSNTEAGINLVAGTSIPTSPNAPMFAELRVGVGDIPDLHIMAGWNFPLRH